MPHKFPFIGPYTISVASGGRASAFRSFLCGSVATTSFRRCLHTALHTNITTRCGRLLPVALLLPLLLLPLPCPMKVLAAGPSLSDSWRFGTRPLRNGGLCSSILLSAGVGLALRVLSAMDVTWLTPLGPLFSDPVATAPGCNVTASRCRGLGAGFAVADPPPRFASGGLPFVL